MRDPTRYCQSSKTIIPNIISFASANPIRTSPHVILEGTLNCTITGPPVINASLQHLRFFPQIVKFFYRRPDTDMVKNCFECDSTMEECATVRWFKALSIGAVTFVAEPSYRCQNGFCPLREETFVHTTVTSIIYKSNTPQKQHQQY